MNFLNLEYFLIVAKRLSITKAAFDLNISQQALSRHILDLEKELKTPLFFRRRRKLELTEAGTCLMAYATQMLNLKTQLLMNISDITDYERGSINVGITQARSHVYMPFLLQRFFRIFPEIKVIITEDISENLFSALQNDKLDLVIGIEPNDNVNFSSIPLCNEDYVIMWVPSLLEKYMSASEIDKLYEKGNDVSIESFKKCPFICFAPSVRNGKIFLDACKSIGFRPKIVVESKSTNTLIYLCALGVGVTVCPRIHLELLKKQSKAFEEIQTVPVTTLPLSTNIVLTTKRGNYISKATQQLIKIAKEEFELSEQQLSSATEFFTSRRLGGRLR